MGPTDPNVGMLFSFIAVAIASIASMFVFLAVVARFGFKIKISLQSFITSMTLSSVLFLLLTTLIPMPEEEVPGSIGQFELMSLALFVITLISFVVFLKIFRKKNIREQVLIKCTKSNEKEKPFYKEILSNLEKIEDLSKKSEKMTEKSKFWHKWKSKK